MAPTDLVRDMGREAAFAAPPWFVAIYAAATNAVPLLVGIATLVYIGIQVWFLLRKARWQGEDRKAARTLRERQDAIEDAP